MTGPVNSTARLDRSRRADRGQKVALWPYRFEGFLARFHLAVDLRAGFRPAGRARRALGAFAGAAGPLGVPSSSKRLWALRWMSRRTYSEALDRPSPFAASSSWSHVFGSSRRLMTLVILANTLIGISLPRPGACMTLGTS